MAFVPIQTSFPIVVLLNSSKELTSVQLVPVPFLFAVKIGDVETHFNECIGKPMEQSFEIEQNLPIYLLLLILNWDQHSYRIQF